MSQVIFMVLYLILFVPTNSSKRWLEENFGQIMAMLNAEFIMQILIRITFKKIRLLKNLKKAKHR